MVDRIDPSTGDVVFRVNLPDNTSEASCCCFGGKYLDILFITTAHENIDPESEPHAGGLYAVKLPSGITGCQEKRFRTSRGVIQFFLHLSFLNMYFIDYEEDLQFTLWLWHLCIHSLDLFFKFISCLLPL